MTDLVNIVN